MGLLNWLVKLFLGGASQPARGASARTARPPAPPPSSSSDTRTAPEPPSQRASLEALDVSQFTPLEESTARKLAGQVGLLWANPFFGRRDIIPPASDARTLIIDRSMVAHGFITPEELVEIHEIGAEMDRLRPDLALAQQAASDAVRQSQDEREELKRQKKAEAAERRRQHAEAVAHRRATDIIFLGRGVSKGLAERESDVAKLTAAGLPVLSTPADVAAALEVSIPRLRWLAFHIVAATRTHYLRFEVPKKSGGMRTLFAPHRDLARCQQWLLHAVLEQLPVHTAAHGFVRGRSTVSGATLHAGSDVVLNVDLKDFFPSITFPRVKGAIQQLGYSPAVATIFALLATEAPRRRLEYAGTVYDVATGPRALPQGACTSPALSNLIVRRLDARLAGIARTLGWTYTRYADDLTFSTSGEPGTKVGYLLARIRHIVADEGFELNPPKTRVQRRNTAQTVTGIVVNHEPHVPRAVVRRLRAILHRAKSEGLAAQNRDNHPHFEDWVRGMIAYVAMVNPLQAEPLEQALKTIDGPQ